MMDAGKIAKQTITFQKKIFDNVFQSMGTIQEQTEEMTFAFLKQMPWIPEQGQQGIKDAIKSYKKNREDFKKAVDESFEKMEELFKSKQ